MLACRADSASRRVFDRQGLACNVSSALKPNESMVACWSVACVVDVRRASTLYKQFSDCIPPPPLSRVC